MAVLAMQMIILFLFLFFDIKMWGKTKTISTLFALSAKGWR